MIYEAHFDNLRRYLIFRSGDQDLSKDIAQNVFMRVWTKKIEIASGNIKSLLFKMATDEFISYIRKKKLQKEYTESLDLKLIREPDNNDNFLEKKVLFQKALNQLPEKQKTALLMNKMQGLTYKEIAEILNLSQKAIEKRIGLAIKALKQNIN